nr:MAG TPA: hypothetical protein [Bacteriophage sp.]
MLREMVIDFVLFSGIEGFIFCLFFEKIGGCRKFKWYEWLILSIGNCLISQLLPPTLYQFVCVLWMCVFLYIVSVGKITKCMKLSALSVLCFFIYEVIYSIVLLYGLNFDGLQRNLSCKDLIELFIFMIPLRIIEIISIIIYTKRRR